MKSLESLLNTKRRVKTIRLDDNVRYEEEKKKFDRKCKCCGYTNRILNKYKKIPCKHCGNYVFLNDYEEFKYRVMEKIINEKEN